MEADNPTLIVRAVDGGTSYHLLLPKAKIWGKYLVPALEKQPSSAGGKMSSYH